MAITYSYLADAMLRGAKMLEPKRGFDFINIDGKKCGCAFGMLVEGLLPGMFQTVLDLEENRDMDYDPWVREGVLIKFLGQEVVSLLKVNPRLDAHLDRFTIRDIITYKYDDENQSVQQIADWLRSLDKTI